MLVLKQAIIKSCFETLDGTLHLQSFLQAPTVGLAFLVFLFHFREMGGLQQLLGFSESQINKS